MATVLPPRCAKAACQQATSVANCACVIGWPSRTATCRSARPCGNAASVSDSQSAMGMGGAQPHALADGPLDAEEQPDQQVRQQAVVEEPEMVAAPDGRGRGHAAIGDEEGTPCRGDL